MVKKPVQIWFPEEIHAQIKATAALNGVSMQQLIIDAMAKVVKENKK